MYEQEVISMLEGQVAFVATVNGISPQVRPMRAHVDSDGSVLLYCSACRRADEIAVNDSAALCVMADDDSVLRMNGQLEAVLPHDSASRRGQDGVAYQFRIHSILYNSCDGITYSQVESPQEIKGILLKSDNAFCLT